MRNSFIKILAALVIVALNWSGLSAVIETVSYYLDNEGDGANTFTAATLDFSLAAGNLEFISDRSAGAFAGR